MKAIVSHVLLLALLVASVGAEGQAAPDTTFDLSLLVKGERWAVYNRAVAIAEDAFQASQETDKVSKNVTDFNKSIEETSKGAVSASEQAESLALLAGKLKKVIGQFKI